jgi:CRP-like cAMP-binding protein
MSVQADAETLRQIPIFANCQPVHLQLLAFASERQRFATGDMIIEQGQQAKSAFLILNGSADIFQKTSGRVQSIATAEPGTLLGEAAMIGRGIYAVSARAAEPVATARIDYSLFLRVATEYPEFGQTVLAALARKLEASMQEFETVRPQFTRARSFSDF